MDCGEGRVWTVSCVVMGGEVWTFSSVMSSPPLPPLVCVHV